MGGCLRRDDAATGDGDGAGRLRKPRRVVWAKEERLGQIGKARASSYRVYQIALGKDFSRAFYIVSDVYAALHTL